ncbi:MAG: glutamine--fructose-6-phosphate transaminase (isomerizing) [Alphaproteobacteria bacterium]
MCGIVGIVGQDGVVPRLLQALQHLEYRGYDSAGIATVNKGQLDRRRAVGKLSSLDALIGDAPLEGAVGIGHTRWATHGVPSERNAHPHSADGVGLVHNGIIENFRDLKHRLEADGFVFETDTDSEVIAHLIASHKARGLSPEASVQASLGDLHGAFALAVIFEGEDDLMIGARRGSPLVVGFGDGEMYLGSDAIGLAGITKRVAYLEEDDWVILSRSGADLRDASGGSAARDVKVVSISPALVGKGNHRHFMAKEIHEQPDAVAHTLSYYVDPVQERIVVPDSPDFRSVNVLNISACGTAFYAGLVARYWFERLARLPVDLDVASEFRYREPLLLPGSRGLFISQSGETADTLAALRYCRDQGVETMAIVNAPESTMVREADRTLPTFAGPEIGVASTKAFISQLSVLSALAIAAGRARGVLDNAREAELVRHLLEVPGVIAAVLRDEGLYEALGHDLAKARDVLFIGRGITYPIALEGALKLKEISYIHAEGYAAGELKHGPIALVDEQVPVVILAPFDELFSKTVSNMEEVAARGGRVVLVTDPEGRQRAGDRAWRIIEVPKVDPLITPLLYVVPVQLLAYWTAVAKGTDVDQPRNLAKSVTVE